MSGGKYLGFYFYRAGVNPKELKVGNIVWDYREPTRNSPYQHDEDLITGTDFFDPRDWPNYDVNFKDESELSAALGLQNVVWIGGHWNRNVTVHFTSEKVIEKHLLSGKEAEFEHLVISNPRAQEWLQLHLSAAYTTGTIMKRLFRRPKLWLCTGLVQSVRGTYEVDYSGTKGSETTLSDPTQTIPVSSGIKHVTSSGSNRKHDFSGETIIAAQWMLLYCKNKRCRKAPSAPYIVNLTTKYADDNVKGVEAVFGLVSTSRFEIDQAEARGVELFDVSDDDEDEEDEDWSTQETEGRHEESSTKIFQPMFPSNDISKTELEEYRKFKAALQLLKEV